MKQVFSLASFHLWVTKLHGVGKTLFVSGTATLGKLLVVGLIENLDISASSGVVVRGF